MNELSLYILDLVQNSIEAGAKNIAISITEDLDKDTFIIYIEDDGKGIPGEFIDKVIDPFFTTRTTRKVGLGLSLANQLAKDCNGTFSVDSSHRGTRLTIVLQHSHIDRPPLGNIVDTLLALIAANPNIDFVYTHKVNKQEFLFKTKDIRKIIGEDIPINLPGILEFIKNELILGLSNLGGGAD